MSLVLMCAVGTGKLCSFENEYDKAVMAAYGFSTKMTEADCVAELMKLYQKLIAAK